MSLITEASIAEAAQAAKDQIKRSDDITTEYKAVLRMLPEDNDTSPNRVLLEWIKTEGFAESQSQSTLLKLQLSSPVEEAELSALQSKVQFQDVETSQATLSVSMVSSSSVSTREDDGGLTTTHDVDVATVTHQLLNALQPAALYETELVVPVQSSSSTTTTTTGAVTLKVSYTPSTKDQREKLFYLIEKETSTKAAAREELRRASVDLHMLQQEQQAAGGGGVGQAVAAQPAVQAGFLNKDKSGTPTTTTASTNKPKAKPAVAAVWNVWYRHATVIGPVAKNYVLFVGFIVASHYYGSHLAIPAPV